MALTFNQIKKKVNSSSNDFNTLSNSNRPEFNDIKKSISGRLNTTSYEGFIDNYKYLVKKQSDNTKYKTRSDISGDMAQYERFKSQANKYLKELNDYSIDKSNYTPEQISSFKRAMEEIASGSNELYKNAEKSIEFYSQFKDENEYNGYIKAYNIASKYEGKSYADMLKNYDKADADERKWIDENKYSFMTTDELEQEKDRLTKQAQEIKDKNGGIIVNQLNKAVDIGSYIANAVGQKSKLKGKVYEDKTAKANDTLNKLSDLSNQLEKVTLAYEDKKIKSYTDALTDDEKQMLDIYLASKDTRDGLSKSKADFEMYNKYGATDSSFVKDYFINEKKLSKKEFDELASVYSYGKDKERSQQIASSVYDFTKNKILKDDGSGSINKAVAPATALGVVANTAVAIPSGIIGGVDYANQYIQEKLTGNDNGGLGLNRYSFGQAGLTTAQAIRQAYLDRYDLDYQTKTKLGNLFLNADENGNIDIYDKAYNTIESTAENVGRLALASATGGATGISAGASVGMQMGMSVFAQSVTDYKSKGYSDNKAVALATCNAGIEALTEKYSVEQILKPSKSFGQAIRKAFVAEGSEEVASNVLGYALDEFVNGKNSEKRKLYQEYIDKGYSEKEALQMTFQNMFAETVEAGIVGGISGVFMGGGSYVTQNARIGANNIAKNIDNSINDKARATDIINGNTELKQLAMDIAGVDYTTYETQKQKYDSLYNEYLSKAENDTVTKDDTKNLKKAQKDLNKAARDVARTLRVNIESEAGKAKFEALTTALENKGYNTETIKAVEKAMEGQKILSEYEQNLIQEIDKADLNSAIEVADDVYMSTRNSVQREALAASTTKQMANISNYNTVNGNSIEVVDNGERASVLAFDNVSKGTLKLSNDKVVKATDTQMSDGMATLVQGILDISQKFKLDEEQANSLLNYGKEVLEGTHAQGVNLKSQDFVFALEDAMKFGSINNIKALNMSTYTSDFYNMSSTRNAILNAFNIAKDIRDSRASEKAKNKTTSRKTGNVTLHNVNLQSIKDVKKRERTEKQMNFMSGIAKMLGFDLHFFQTENNVWIDENGVKHTENGSYNPNTNEMWIDINSGNFGEGFVLFTAAHEVTHYLRVNNEVGFNEFADYLVSQMSPGAFDQLMQETARREGKDLNNTSDYDYVYEEVMADSAETFLRDGNLTDNLQDLRNTSESAYNGFAEALKNFISKIKDALAQIRQDGVIMSWRGYTNAGKYTASLQNIEHTIALWDKALADTVSASENVQDAYTSDNYSGIPSTDVTEPLVEQIDEQGTLKSNRTFTEPMEKFIMPLGNGKIKKYKKGEKLTTLQVLENISANSVNGKEKLNKIKKVLTEMSKFMNDAAITYTFIGLDDVNNASISYDAETGRYIFSAMVKNGDYPVNFDFTTICKKRDSASRFINDILSKTDANGNKISQNYRLSTENLVLLNDALRKNGYETACLGCFVEAKRFNIDTWASTIVDEWNSSVLQFNPNADYLINDGKDVSTSKSVNDLTQEEIDELDQTLKDNISQKKRENWLKKLSNANEKVKTKEKDLALLKEALDKASDEYAKASEQDKQIYEKKFNEANKNYIKAYDSLEKAKITRDNISKSPTQESSVTPAERASEIIKTRADYQKLIKISDLITKDGIRKIAKEYPELMTFIKTRYGTATPKLTQGFTPYNSEIALLSNTKGRGTKLIDYLYSIAGMRGQSFSDFKIEYVFDYLQLFADAGMRELPMHFYTKEISFAKLFGRMGAKINLSVMYNIMNEDYWADHMDELKAIGESETDVKKIAKKYVGMYFDDAGRLVPLVADAKHSKIESIQKYFNGAVPQQSVDYDEALKLQKTKGFTGDVGTIGVGYGDFHIRALLRDRNIRYVIPYHSSSLPVEVKDRTHISLATDYTSTQNTLKISKMLQNGQEITFGMWLKQHNYSKFDENNSIGIIKQLNKEIADGTIKISTAKAKAGHGDFNLYTGAYGIKNTNNPKKTIEHYVAYCLNNGYLPVFYQFADEENYYKLHYDFNVYDNATEKYAAQGGVHFDVGNLQEFKTMVRGYMSELNQYNQEQYTAQKIDQTESDWMQMVDEKNANLIDKYWELANNPKAKKTDIERIIKNYTNSKGIYVSNDELKNNLIAYDNNGNVIPLDERFSQTKFSTRDSEGQTLTPAQQEYFKDSKVRDADGNLLVVYHGTDADFTVFDRTKGRHNMDIQGSFFSPWELDSQGYGANVKAYYLNITNPASEQMGYKALRMFQGQNNAGVKAREYLESLGYDGVNNSNEEYIAFDSNQIKLIDNTNPTDSEDVRYSNRNNDYVIDNNFAVMTRDRILREIEDSSAGTNKAYARRYITTISPTDYLNLTTGTRTREFFDEKIGGDYGNKMGEYDYDSELAQNEMTPYLMIDLDNKRVIGHDGRHRMRALEKKGIDSVEIVIELYDKNGMVKYPNGYDGVAEAIRFLNVIPQDFKYLDDDVIDAIEEEYEKDSPEYNDAVKIARIKNSINNPNTRITEVTLEDVMPLNRNYQDRILATYGEDANREASVKYSSRDAQTIKSLQKQNELLKDDNKYLKELVKLQNKETHGQVFTKTSLEAMAKKLMKQFGAKGNAKELANILQEYYGWIAKGDELTWDEVMNRTSEASKWLDEHTPVDTTLTEEAQSVIDGIRSTKIKLNDMQKSEVANRYDSYNNYRKGLMGNATFSNDGTSLDIVWQEWANEFPEIFDADMNSQDMPQALADIIYQMKNSYESDLYDDTAKYDYMRDAIYDGYWDVSTLYTVADKYQKQITELKIKHRDKLNEVRANRDEQIAKLKQKYKDSKHEAVVRRQNTATKHTIARKWNRLYSLLSNPTKEKNIGYQYQGVIKDILLMINPDISAKGPRGNKAREQLAAQIENLKNIQTEASALEVDDVLQGRIDELKAIQYKPFNSLTDSELQMVNEALTIANALVKKEKEIFNVYGIGKIYDVETAGKEVEHELTSLDKNKNLKTSKIGPVSIDKIREFSWSLFKPEYAFRYIGSQTLNDLYKIARKGDDTMAIDMDEADKFCSDMAKKYKADKWDRNKTFHFEIDNQDVQLKLGEIMSLYAYSKREQAQDHLSDGGIKTVSPIDKKLKGVKIGEEKRTLSERSRLNPIMLSSILSKLTDEQRQFVDEMQSYLSETMGAKGNEVSRALYEIDLFNEKNYFPLLVDKDFLARESKTQQTKVSLKSAGFTKKLVKNANKPVVLEDFFDVWARHTVQMSQYHAYTLGIENLVKVFNYTDYMENDFSSKSVKSLIRGIYGDEAVEYLDKFMVDLNGGSKSESSVASSMFSKFKKTAVGASLSTAIQQPTAIVRAMAYVNPKYFASQNLKHKTNWNELKQYAPVAILKEIGGFDIGSGTQMTDYLVKNFDKSFMDKLDDATMYLAAKGDELGWNMIWNAVKKETKDNYPKLQGDELLKKAGERFTDVVSLTQVYDSTFSRSGIMRSKNAWNQIATSFMGEPMTSLNMYVDAVVQANRGKINKVQSARVISSVMVASILACILKAIPYASRDDDKDSSWVEKYLKQVSSALVDELNPLNLIPYVRDAWSLLQGNDVERGDLTQFKNLFKAIQNLDNDSRSTYRQLEDLLGGFAAFFGIPLKNIMRDARGMFNLVASAFDDNTPDANNTSRAFKEGLFDSWNSVAVNLGKPELQIGKTSMNSANKLYDKGKDDKAEKMIENIIAEKEEKGKTEKEAKSSVRSSMTSYWKPLYIAAYEEGDTQELARIRRILYDSGVYGSTDDVVKTCANWVKKN